MGKSKQFVLDKDKNLHQAFSDPIFSAIGEIAEKMQTRAFAIGGCVRDALLQRKDTKDIDIVCERVVLRWQKQLLTSFQTQEN